MSSISARKIRRHGAATRPAANAPLTRPDGGDAAARLAEIFGSTPGPSWDVEADPTLRRTKHVYQQLLIWHDLLEQQGDDEGRELARVLKGPMATLKTRLSNTPARARRYLLHSIDHGATTVPEFVTETRLPRPEIESLLVELVAEGVVEKRPDGRSNQGPPTYLYTRKDAVSGDSYGGPAVGRSSLASATPFVD